MNRKGFVFVETIIVIAIMLSSLMLIYSLYASSVSNENIRLRYDDTAKLYETFYLKKYLESFDLDALKARINDGEPYQMIYRGTSEVFGSSYSNEKIFLENMWMDLHIESIILFGSNISEIVECNRDDTAMICSNTSLLNYLKTLDDEAGYRLVIEYAMDESGNTCTSPIGCYYYYSSVKVDEYLSLADRVVTCSSRGKEASRCFLENGNKDKRMLAYDKTYDNNLRYIGKNPNNYVSFNNEIWRIIGVFNNIDNGSGTTETRIKLIRDELLVSEWDDQFYNHWELSSLQRKLNSSYYEGLTNEAKEMIGDVVWRAGKFASVNNPPNSVINEEGIPNGWYNYERGIGTSPVSNITAKVGIMYASDYGFAVGDNMRDSCLNTVLKRWDNLADCYNNDWLYNANHSQWVLNSSPNGYETNFAYYITETGGIETMHTVNTASYKPVVFLKANIKILAGTGEKNNPFVLGL